MALTILALDTSTEACSAALLYNDKITTRYAISDRDHVKRILPMVDDILEESDCCLEKVDAIAFSRGPGSFTGIRIGIGIAQGLAFGADKPLIAVSTLETLAEGAHRISGAMDVVSAIDARMNEVYFAHYRYKEEGIWEVMGAEEVLAPTSLLQTSFLSSKGTLFSAGSGFETYPDLVPSAQSSHVRFPEAQDMINLAKISWHHNHLLRPDEVEPIYLRNQVTWKKMPGRGL